jgi:hypothetical protein
MYVIVSLLEVITGFYEQNSKSKSKIERDIPEMGISLFLDVAFEESSALLTTDFFKLMPD